MTTTVTPVETIPSIGHREAYELACAEYDRLIDLVRAIPADEFDTPTDNELWNVRAVLGHILGTLEGNASMRENAHQLLKARKGPGAFVDNLSAIQVDERVDLPNHVVVERIVATAPKAAKGRKRVPAPLRSLVKIRVEIPGITEQWKLGFLTDIIYTRDAWMHRVDLSRAIGRELVLTPEHDGRIVADVVAEWARRHGQPFTLMLEGPAGGTFTAGDGGETITVDAVEFCRITSGRAAGEGLLSQTVAF